MIVLGIDGSLTATGLAVIETDGVPGRERILATAVKRTGPDDGDDTTRHRLMVGAGLYLARRYRPDFVGIEMPYVDPKRSMDVAIRLAGLKSAFETALKDAGYEVVPVAAASVGKALGVKGKRDAKKAQAVANVEARYGISVCDDMADAIGVCLAAVAKRKRLANERAQLGLGIKGGRKQRKGRRATCR